MSVLVCFSLAIYLNYNWKMHPDVFLQVWLWEFQYEIDNLWMDIVYFCNCKNKPFAEHLKNRQICFPKTVTPFLHASLCAKARFMLQKSSVWLTILFETLDCLYWLSIFKKSFEMNYRPMTSIFVVRDFIFHSINKRQFIFLFHHLFKSETLVGTYISQLKEVMHFVECTIVQLVHFMKPINILLYKSRIQVCSVFWNCNIRCKHKYREETKLNLGWFCSNKSDIVFALFHIFLFSLFL